MRPLNIAMDGPAGAGKSSVADAVAAALHILHLDTGAMYRTVALGCRQAGVDYGDEQAVTAVCAGLQIDVAYDDRGQQTLLNGDCVNGLIREPDISRGASAVARYAGVRRMMVENQRRLARTQPMLLDGRDIGTVVLPDAQVKIFLTASPEERARRRWEELKAKGGTDSYEQVLVDLKQRDDQDMNRKVDPLRPAEDAVTVDTTALTFDQVVGTILDLVREKTGVSAEEEAHE